MAPHLDGMNAADRQATWDAARGRCGACGRSLGADGVVHHRKLKGMGGQRGARAAGTFHDRPPITEVLHDACHKWVHDHPARARQTGHIVSAWLDAADVPVTVVEELRR